MAASNLRLGDSHKTNFARIGHASQHLMSNILQQLLASYENPSTIFNRVNSCQKLKRRLPVSDWKKINSALKQGYIDFDIPLIYTILRNLHDPSIRPSRDWDLPVGPQPFETSIGDDLERCRRSRNYILHRGNTLFTDQDVNDIFSEFESIAERFEKALHKQPNEFVSEFKNLRTCSMDEATKKMYLDNLQDLMKNEKVTLESIQALEIQGTQTEERMFNVEQDLQSLKGKKITQTYFQNMNR